MTTAQGVVVRATARSGGSRAPVLVVDDEDESRAVLSGALEHAGYEVVEAADAQAALFQIEAGPVSLILLDLRMPGMGGLDLLRELRLRPGSRTLPIILVTAVVDSGERIRGLDTGANDYLNKPVSVDELLARVGAHLRVHSDWARVTGRIMKERWAIASVLRDIRTATNVKATAGALADRLAALLNRPSVAILVFEPDGSIAPLAARGSWERIAIAGSAFPPAVARSLRRRAARGPWVQQPRAGADAAGEDWDAAWTAFSPFYSNNELVGLLAVSDGAGRGPGTTAIRPALHDFADFVGPLIGPAWKVHRRRSETRARMARLISDGAFEPAFQPVCDLVTRLPVGYEALTRFDDQASPEARFTEASALGLDLELQLACLTKAVRQCARLTSCGWISLNVSPAMILQSPDLRGLLAGSPHPVVLELTERDCIESYGPLREAIAALGSGVRLAVDDAGAGFASFRHILELHPHFVKLDVSLTRGVDRDPARQALAAGMEFFARKTGVDVVAEGIETPAELQCLRTLGVRLGQGYLLGRPRKLSEPLSGDK